MAPGPSCRSVGTRLFRRLPLLLVALMVLIATILEGSVFGVFEWRVKVPLVLLLSWSLVPVLRKG